MLFLWSIHSTLLATWDAETYSACVSKWHATAVYPPDITRYTMQVGTVVLSLFINTGVQSTRALLTALLSATIIRHARWYEFKVCNNYRLWTNVQNDSKLKMSVRDDPKLRIWKLFQPTTSNKLSFNQLRQWQPRRFYFHTGSRLITYVVDSDVHDVAIPLVVTENKLWADFRNDKKLWDCVCMVRKMFMGRDRERRSGKTIK